MPRAATSPLACSRVTTSTVGAEPREPFAVAVGAVEVQRLAVAPHAVRPRPERDRGRRTRRCRRPRAVARSVRSAPAASCASKRCIAVSFAWRRAQKPLVLSGVHDHSSTLGPGLGERVGERSGRRPRTTRRVRRRGGGSASDQCVPRFGRPVDDDRARPTDGCGRCDRGDRRPSTAGTTAPARRRPARPRRGGERGAVGADGVDVLVVRSRPSSPESTGAASISSGPLFTGLLTSVVTGHASSSSAGDGTSSLPQRVDVVVLRVEPRVPLRLGQDHRHPVVDRRA